MKYVKWSASEWKVRCLERMKEGCDFMMDSVSEVADLIEEEF